MMAELTNSSCSSLTNSSCSSLWVRTACYLAVLYNIAVFAANFILYVNDRSSWQDDSNTEWVCWQWVDLAISGVSILAALLLYCALITGNHRLLQVFLSWTVFCIVLSILVLGFGFRELERGHILARCIGIVVSAYFADVVFSYYLKLKESGQVASRESQNRQSYTLEPIPPGYPGQSDMVNGGFYIEDETSNTELQNNNIRNVCLWYEDTKF
ncbi:Hypothetical predicted protein [Paramuricea clavata]|uniref:Uncharacterized protein n=1 Tax=Paramuricea clavata TaxID=317549 RepID=A0A6S7I6T0_PARCT|nr:Hypothetical predicted protein [Paramuricea clavata]